MTSMIIQVCIVLMIMLTANYRMLGMEAVLLWNAVLLKKRILVVSEGSGNQNMMKLLNTVRSLPQLAYHRQDWGILRPLVSSSGEMDSLHIDDLASCGVFIAGTVDPTLATSHSSLFDVIFSLSDHRVTISDDAKSSMRMGSTHRELAQVNMNCRTVEYIIFRCQLTS